VVSVKIIEIGIELVCFSGYLQSVFNPTRVEFSSAVNSGVFKWGSFSRFF